MWAKITEYAPQETSLTMVRALFTAIGMTLMLLLPISAGAQNVMRIAAVVNDDAISVLDLVARLKMVLLTTGLPDSPETRNRLAPQVLRALIDERLQLQEARRLSIGVNQEEVGTAVRTLETQINLPEGGARNLLDQAKIPFSTLEQQIRAQLAWSKIIANVVQPTVQIGDDEVENYIEEQRALLGQPQFRVGEVFLAVDSPSVEVTVRDRARQLAEEIRNGAAFRMIANQFSENAAAAAGGDLGWIRPEQLQPELAAVIPTLKRGEVSEPIRSSDGFHLLYVANVRNQNSAQPEPTVSIQQISMPMAEGIDESGRQTQVDLAHTVAEVVEGCSDLTSVGREMGALVSQRLTDLKLNDLSESIRSKIADLPTGKASEPIVQPNGVLLVMVCERTSEDGVPSKNEAYNTIAREKLDLLAQRYMRDLRNAAFIDLRV